VKQPVILQVNTARGWRGGERQVLWLTERLNAWGVRSIVASPPTERLANEVIGRGLPHVSFSPRGEWDWLAVRALRRSAAAHGVNVLNSHDGHANTLAALARTARQRFVITRRVHHRLRNMVSRWKFARADLIIAISGAVADVMRSAGVKPDRLTIIHSGVDLERARLPASQDTLRSLGITPGRPFAVQIGIAGHKDPFTFLRAIAEARSRIPELQGLLIGSDPSFNAVDREIERAGLRNAVFLAGQRADADQLMCAADVVVMSSTAEGLGTAALDAMWARKPLVATRTAAIVDFARDGANALLAPVGDATALGMQIVRALQDRELKERIVLEASRTVEGFSADTTARRTLDAYLRLALA